MQYESQVIDPEDRSSVIEISGQEKVPTIVDGETVMNESTDIVAYLDQYYGNGKGLIPERPEDRSRVFLLDRYADGVWGLLTYQALKNVDMDGNSLDADGEHSLRQTIDKEAGILDELFQNTFFTVGERVSLADISISAFISRIKVFSNYAPPERYTHLWDWYTRVEDQL